MMDRPAASWARRSGGVKVGDKVAYSRQFLQQTDQYRGDVPHARGTVTAIQEGENGSPAVATVDWNQGGLPPRTLLATLVRVTEKGIIDPA